MRVDGNAIAGMLREVFNREMTSARIACDGCGEVESIGAQHVYMWAPSIVLRCCHCDSALIVITRAQGRSLLSLRGSRWLELAEPD